MKALFRMRAVGVQRSGGLRYREVDAVTGTARTERHDETTDSSCDPDGSRRSHVGRDRV